MTAASALTRGVRLPFLAQYSMTMEMQAAPQPSFCCLTKGTSSQMALGTAAMATLARLTPTTTRLAREKLRMAYATKMSVTRRAVAIAMIM